MIGSASIGTRFPQITWYQVLTSEFPHWLTLGQSTGKAGGGASLDQFVTVRPESLSWRETVPWLETASAELSRSSVDQARSKAPPLLFATVTFSFVGVML